MKTAKLIAILGIFTLAFSACGASKKDRCPSVGEKTTRVR
jgi:hypothetical protein